MHPRFFQRQFQKFKQKAVWLFSESDRFDLYNVTLQVLEDVLGDEFRSDAVALRKFAI